MAKEAYYFSHDSNARLDDKILELRAEFGWHGYGLFWAVIETLRDCSNYTYPSNARAGLALSLNIAKTDLEQFLNVAVKLGLLVEEEGVIYSESLMKRMEDIDEKRRKRAEAGRLGGIAKSNGKQISSNAKANPSKEKKVKESKVKEKKEKETTIVVGQADPVNSDYEIEGGSGLMQAPHFSSAHQNFIKIYCDWFHGKTGVAPKMNAGDGKAAKELLPYLKNQSLEKTDSGAIKAFEYILKNWHKLEPFIQKQTKLVQIGANINNILDQLKNGTPSNSRPSANESAAIAANEAREILRRDRERRKVES
jgi:hypothetical protein